MQIILSLVLLSPKNRTENCLQFCNVNRLIKNKIYWTYSSVLPVQMFQQVVRNARPPRLVTETKRTDPHSIVQCDYLFGSKKCFQIIWHLLQTYFVHYLVDFTGKCPMRLCRRDWNLGFFHPREELLSLADSSFCLCLSPPSFMPSLDSAQMGNMHSIFLWPKF